MTEATDPQALRDAATESAPPTRRADFDRPLVCILGLPFDAINVAQAVQRIRDAAFAGRRCFVSTPNLNFAMAARTDADFRGSVLRSDLSVVDGMSLVWVGRLLGLPLQERVSGADVFDALVAHKGPPVSVYLFGGPPGAAAAACDGINRRAGGLRCVGFDAAGFGSVESMSSNEQIDRINRSGARFVVVSLGAGKGQAWIEHNASRLTSPVLAHLGAVVNFAAGTVLRAPRWAQSSGFEWLWRVKEEPSLWRRYWRDGIGALGLLVRCVVPDAIAARRLLTGPPLAEPARLESSTTPRGHVVRLRGDWRADEGLGALRAALTKCAADGAHLTIDLAEVTDIGGTVTALLLVARGWFDAHGGLDIVGANGRVVSSLRRKLAIEPLLGPA